MGKSGGASPPAVQQLPAPAPLPVPQFTQEAPVEAPVLPSLPDKIERVELPDFSDRMDQLRQKAKADYLTEQSKKRTRQSTVKTSSLLDDEEVNTTGLLDE